MLSITSRNNEKIKNAVKLCTDSSERKKSGMFFLEGLRLCCDAVKNSITPECVFVTESALNKNGEELAILLSCAKEIYIITQEIAEKLSDTKNTQGVFCICKTLDKKNNIDKINYNGIYIALENIQTPLNLGAAVRTAEAFGLDGIIVSGGCDIYNPKALRAAMGAMLRINVIYADDMSDILNHCSKNGMKVYAAVPDSHALSVTEMDRSGGIVCAVGNEGNGLSERVIEVCTEITIPMRGRAESLNAAAAASVIMWEMTR